LIEKEKCLQQHVVTAETNARYHSSQKRTDLSIAESASKITNPQKEAVVLDLAADPVMVEVIEALGSVAGQEMTDHEKCLQQHVATAETNARYHSSQKRTDLSIAMNASKTTETR